MSALGPKKTSPRSQHTSLSQVRHPVSKTGEEATISQNTSPLASEPIIDRRTQYDIPPTDGMQMRGPGEGDVLVLSSGVAAGMRAKRA